MIEPTLAAIEIPIPASVEEFGFAAPSVVDFAGLPLTDLAVSPSGAWFAINRGTEICLLDPSIGSETSDEGCLDFAGTIAPGSLAWSPDESAVAFAFDWPEESDIGVLDVSSQSIDALTANDDETSSFDVAPFYSEDGTLHFLRSAPFPYSFYIIEFGDTPITLGSLEAESFPGSARRDPVSGTIVVEVGESGPYPSIVTLDLVEGTSTLIEGEFDTINRRPFLDVAGGHALVGQGPIPEVDGIRAALIELRRGDAATAMSLLAESAASYSRESDRLQRTYLAPLAGTAAHQLGEDETAARLFGHGRAMAVEFDVNLRMSERPLVEQASEQCRATLGADCFDELADLGSSCNWTELVELLLPA